MRQLGAGAVGWGRSWWRGAIARGTGQGVARGPQGHGVPGGDLRPSWKSHGGGEGNGGRLGNGVGFRLEGKMGWKEEKKKRIKKKKKEKKQEKEK